MMSLRVTVGDIAKLDGDAIVNEDGYREGSVAQAEPFS